MAKTDFALFLNKTVFITGSQKNAGKTTFLKYAVSSLRSEGARPAYFSIGVDGETEDGISGRLKPVINAQAGDYIVTAESALSASGAGFGIIDVLPEKSVFGRQVVAEVLRAGQVELIGAPGNRRIGEIIEAVRHETKANAILIDGAVDRLTQVGASDGAGYVAVMLVEPSNLKRMCGLMRLGVQMDGIPVSSRVGDDVYEVEGALTPAKAASVPKERSCVAIEDFTKVFLSPLEMQRLCGRYEVFFRRRRELLYIVVNLSGMIASDFMRQLADDAVAERLVMNPYAA